MKMGRFVFGRAVIWILVALLLGGGYARRIWEFREAGLPLGWAPYLFLAVWIAVLVFWVVAAVRQWQGRAEVRRIAQRKVV